MKILIVGAGAVGQVYARHLIKGGAKVAFWVKEKYRKDMQQPQRMYPLRESRTQSVYVEDYQAYASFDSLPRDWDQVWLCVSSAAIQDATWIQQFSDHLPDSIFVSFLPGLRDKENIAAQLSGQKLVCGLTPTSQP